MEGTQVDKVLKKVCTVVVETGRQQTKGGWFSEVLSKYTKILISLRLLVL